MARKIQGSLHLEKCQLKNVFLALEKYGACSDQLWPFDRSRINVEPSSEAVFDGIQHRLQSYEKVEDIDNYLQRDVHVIIGLSVGELFIHNPSEYRPINGTDNRLMYGHAALIVGSTDNGWILANSFGPKWGDKGYCVLPYECSIDIGEKYAITSFAGITPRIKLSDI
jgi:hypothetical protein